jgi:hypothetical protein
MGLPTTVRMRFSNRCRASGVRLAHPPIRRRQRQLAENIRFRGPPLIRLRRRNSRRLILRSPLAMTPTRLPKIRTCLETGLCYTDRVHLRFIRYTVLQSSCSVPALITRGAFRKWSDIFHCLLVFEKKIFYSYSTYDGCSVNDAILPGCNCRNCQRILDTKPIRAPLDDQYCSTSANNPLRSDSISINHRIIIQIWAINTPSS